MEIKCKIQELKLSVDGSQILSLALQDDFRPHYNKLHNKELSLNLNEYKKKRSVDANAYAWVLIGKLSEKINLPKIEVYKKFIQEVGVYRQVEIDEKAVDTLIHSWSLHGIGWIAEKVDYSKHEGFVIVNLYYGSSTYNTKQMARMIEFIVADCKEQGIETMTPTELERLYVAWK